MNRRQALRRKFEIAWKAPGQQSQSRSKLRRRQPCKLGEMAGVAVVSQNDRPGRQGGDGGHAEGRPNIKDGPGGGRAEGDK